MDVSNILDYLWIFHSLWIWLTKIYFMKMLMYFQIIYRITLSLELLQDDEFTEKKKNNVIIIYYFLILIIKATLTCISIYTYIKVFFYSL